MRGSLRSRPLWRAVSRSLDRRCRRGMLRQLQSAGSQFLQYGVMLRVDPLLELFLTRRVKRQQVKITVCPAVQDSAIVVHHGVDNGVRSAAVFGLHMVDRLANFHVRVVTEQHLRMHSLRATAFRPASTSSRRI